MMEEGKEKDLYEKITLMAEKYQDRCHNAEEILLEMWLCPWWFFLKRKRLIDKAKKHFREVGIDTYWDKMLD